MDVVEHGVDSAHAAAAALELTVPNLRIHPTLLVAWKVMEQAHQGKQTCTVLHHETINRPSIFAIAIAPHITWRRLASFYRVAGSVTLYCYRCYLKPTIIVKGGAMVELPS